MDEINWLSMAVATALPILVGYFYYHKKVFGNIWMDSGKTIAKNNQIVAIIIALILSFFLSFFLLNFNNSGINQEGDFDTFAHGAWHGTFIAITTVTPVIIINGFFGKKSWKHMGINILYWVITLALMGGILDSMNHWDNILLPESIN